MRLPLFCSIKGSIIRAIWIQIILVTIYTTGLVCISNYVWEINFPQTLIPVLGFVTGLLLGFGTNASYDRFYEGRKLWLAMNFNIRTLTRTIWVMVKAKEGEESKTIVKKVSAINALLAFVYATKNYLREEYPYDDDDLKNLIKHIPKFFTPSSEEPNQQDSTRRRMGLSAWRRMEEIKEATPTNIPLELSYFIASYIDDLSTDGVTPAYIIPVMNAALNNLMECLAGFERVSRTPMPFAYSVHLTHVTWLFILALPFQLIGPLNWFAIPSVVLAAFAIFGIFGIGWEIRNPFGNDKNDLPLDANCRALHFEILRIIGYPMPPTDSWLLSPNNHPFVEVEQLPATHLITLKEDELRSLLRKGADKLTKELHPMISTP